MARIEIDGKIFEVETDKSLLETCLALGFDIPYFCFHPAMGSVGACRQCAVKKFNNADDKKGRIIMSCMEPVADGMIISIDDPEAVAFREAVIEGLMTNHPHDCPVCDEGGECHLQDMTVMTEHAYRRYTFKKRTHRNQYLGPFIQHEMNRCIQCYRCLRFYTDYAGGTDFCVSGSGNRVYFGRREDGVLENEFSGNLVEVCPTGVFTDKTLREHYTRKWDLTNSPSVCVHCSIGCNILVSERYGSVRRVLSRYNKDVNGFFLCDRGRFGYEFINNPGRIKKALVKNPSDEKSHEADEGGLKRILSSAIKGKKLVGIGSPRASLESNYALEMLVGKENFYRGISRNEFQLTAMVIEMLKTGFFHSPSLKEIEKADALVILGEDPTNSAPMMALSIRQASRNKSFELAAKRGVQLWNDYPVREIAQDTRTPLFIASSCSTRLDDIATGLFNATPVNIARLGFRIAALIHRSAPSPRNIDKNINRVARSVADFLANADNPVIITGFNLHNAAVLQASVNIAMALARKGKKVALAIIFPECNSLGSALIDGKSLDDLIERINDKTDSTLIILENDLYTRTEKEKADRILGGFKKVIVLDHLLNDTGRKSNIILPAGTFAESTGTIVNNEGRAQRYYRVLPDNELVTDSWRLIAGLAEVAGRKQYDDCKSFDDVVTSLTETYPFLIGIKESMPDSRFRFYNDKIARQTLRFSGRTAMNAGIHVSEPEPPHDIDSPLSFSMEGYKGITPLDLAPYYWAPEWNSVQAMNKYVNAPLQIDELSNSGVLLFSEGSGYVPDFFREIPVQSKTGKGELLIVPVTLIYGSEELSSASRSVSERIPGPFLLLNAKEMKRFKVSENEIIILSVHNTLIRAEVIKRDSMLDGTGGLSVLVQAMQYVWLPALCKPEKQDLKLITD